MGKYSAEPVSLILKNVILPPVFVGTKVTTGIMQKGGGYTVTFAAFYLLNMALKLFLKGIPAVCERGRRGKQLRSESCRKRCLFTCRLCSMQSSAFIVILVMPPPRFPLNPFAYGKMKGWHPRRCEVKALSIKLAGGHRTIHKGAAHMHISSHLMG